MQKRDNSIGKRQYWMRGLWVCGIVMAAIFQAVWLYAGQSTLPRGTRISGLNVGGRSLDEVRAFVQTRSEQWLNQPLSLKGPDGYAPPVPLTWVQLGGQTNVKVVVERLERMRKGSIFRRAYQRYKLHHRELILTAGIDDRRFADAVERLWGKLQREQPKPAERIITAQDKVVYKPEQPVYRIDSAVLKARLEGSMQSWGRRMLQQAPVPTALSLPLRAIRPDVTAAMLKEQGISRKIAEFSTQYIGSGSGRKHNIEATAKVVNNMVLKPGEVFDYDRIVKQTAEKYGFQKAPVIVNGNIVPGIGGGICQVVTTIYNAVLRSGIEVVERRNHSLPISYVPIGQDATFAEGYINFRFRNNTGKYLLIRTQTAGEILTVKLFGTADEQVSYKLESHVVKKIQPPVKTVVNPTLKPGEQQLVQSGKEGFVVETYRIMLTNGKVASQQLISRDTYQPKPTIMAANEHGRRNGTGNPSGSGSGTDGDGNNSGNGAPGGAGGSGDGGGGVQDGGSNRQPGTVVEDGVRGPLFD